MFYKSGFLEASKLYCPQKEGRRTPCVLRAGKKISLISSVDLHYGTAGLGEESLDDSGDCEESRLQGTGGSGAAVKDSMRQTPLAH